MDYILQYAPNKKYDIYYPNSRKINSIAEKDNETATAEREKYDILIFQ